MLSAIILMQAEIAAATFRAEEHNRQLEAKRQAEWNSLYAAAGPELQKLMLFQESQRQADRRHKETLAAIRANRSITEIHRHYHSDF